MRASLAAIAVLALLGCTSAPVPDAGPRPPVPDGLTARPVGVRGVEVGWRDRSEGRTWSVVERRDPGEQTFVSVSLRPPGETSWRDWGLKPDSLYAYRVAAIAQEAASVPSVPVEVKTRASRVPEPVVTVFDMRAVSPGATLVSLVDQMALSSLAAVLAVEETGRVIWQFEHQGPVVTEIDVAPDRGLLLQHGFTTVVVDRKGNPREYMPDVHVHHDVDVLPWGNLLAITSPSIGPGTQWDEPSGEPDPDERTLERIIEFEQSTQQVVESLELESIVPRADTCDLCLKDWLFDHADWLHVNALDYDLEEEALYVSVRNLNRIYKLSYPDAEVEWIMGDGGDFGGGLFSHQHNPSRVAPGRMLLFDNGLHAHWLEPDRSRVVEIEYDPEAGAARVVWEYSGPPAFYSEVMGDVSRLANGNTLVVDSLGHRVIEVSPDGLPVWEMRVPIPYLIYKAHRIENFI